MNESRQEAVLEGIKSNGFFIIPEESDYFDEAIRFLLDKNVVMFDDYARLILVK